jgi:hypothetical protein
MRHFLQSLPRLLDGLEQVNRRTTIQLKFRYNLLRLLRRQKYLLGCALILLRGGFVDTFQPFIQFRNHEILLQGVLEEFRRFPRYRKKSRASGNNQETERLVIRTLTSPVRPRSPS